MRCSDIKILLILIAMLVSIAIGEVSVLVACLAFSACVDEKRFRILFKERRQLTGIIEGLQLLSRAQTNEIKKLQEQLTGIIEGLQLLSRAQTNEIKKLQEQNQQVKNEVNAQTGKIVALREMSQQVKNEVNAQTGKIVALREMSQQVKNEVSAQMVEMKALRQENRGLRDEVEELGWTGRLSFTYTIVFGTLGVLGALGILDFIILKVTELFRSV